MKKLIFIPLFCIIPPLFSSVFASQITKKDSHGFWVNAEEQALKEATKTKKPLFIDFYGIWCPPCNQLDELVFATKEFQKVAKKFVLLKMDADQEKSWLLKSKYGVGGYPTIIIAQADDNRAGNEIDRIVGFFPPAVITTKMNEALASDGKSNQAQLMQLIEKSVLQAEETHDDKLALSYVNAGLLINPDNLKLKLRQIKLQDTAKNKDSQKTLTDLLAQKKKLSVETLLQLFDVRPSKEVIDELLSRVNPSTLYIENESINEADIYSMGVDLEEKTGNEQGKKIYLEMTIASFDKLLKKYGSDSRSLNLSYTYYLQKNGDFKKAQDIYDQMLKKYPHEFTFHYQAAQMGVDMQDYPLARKHINEALKYAYGDNKIRCYDRSVKIAMAAKDKNELKNTIQTTEAFLKSSKSSGDLKVRTDRYLNRLATTLDEAKKQL